MRRVPILPTIIVAVAVALIAWGFYSGQLRPGFG